MKRPTWLRHFGLDAPPLSKDIDAGDLWMPDSRRVLVDQLVDAVHDHQHVLLCGEPGVGKTCTLRALRQRLPEAGFRLTYCHNATLGRRDFYRQLCLALGLSPKATAAAVFYAVSEHIEQLGRDRIHPVFLLDEAHLLHQDVLDHLHVLANYHWDQKPLLSLILVGLPELWDRMTLRRNRSLWSRVHVRLRIPDPSPSDTAQYLGYRLGRVGCKRSPFASDAVALLHEAARGLPRDLDRLATAALKAAARRKLTVVDQAVVTAILDADVPHS